MKKSIIIIFALLSLSLKPPGDRVNDFSISVSNINSQGRYRQLVTDAIGLLNDVLNSDEFKERALNTEFDWIDIAKSARTKMSNQAVYDTLYNSSSSYKMELKITKMGLRYAKFWGQGTVGVTSLYEPSTITFDKPWLNLSPAQYQCTLVTYASHIAHEYCHQRGFSDKNYDQPQYRKVVPYAIGDIVCDLLNKKLNVTCECKE